MYVDLIIIIIIIIIILLWVSRSRKNLQCPAWIKVRRIGKGINLYLWLVPIISITTSIIFSFLIQVLSKIK